MIKKQVKFKFTVEYQWDLLRFTIQDSNGEKAIKKWEDYFFTLTSHQVIAHAMKNYYEKERRLPSQTILREKIVRLLHSKEYVTLVTKDEQLEIIDLIKPLYLEPVKSGDEIYEYCKDFKSYINLKNVIENINLEDYDSYKRFSSQVQLAIEDEDKQEDMQSSFLLKDIRSRQFRRQENKSIFPTPFAQINRLTNAGGYEKNSVIVLLDKQKRGKTMMLANVARGYLKMRKKILMIDLENGKDNMFSRFEQSIMNLNKMELHSGKFDDKVQKRFRKYKRLGGEVIIERLPALVTDCNDIQAIIDNYYRKYGIRFNVILIDYAAKMSSLKKRENDTSRISDVYLEIGNLALKNDIEHVWTANHVNREAARSRMKTRYQGEDIALCIDIVRHAEAIYGLNRSEQEEEAGLFRMELVEHRDGVPSGRAVFATDMSTQKAEELNKADRKKYDEAYHDLIFGDEEEIKTVTKKKRKSDID